VAAAILLAGLATALLVYFAAAPVNDVPGERPEDSKRYLRQMEVYGGQANVLASEIREWLEGLWQGRALAFTVAFLSLLLAGLAFVALTPLPPRVDSPRARHEGEDHPDG